MTLTHKHRSTVVRGKWHRWSRYQLVNGRVVPDLEATPSRYDPWATFTANDGAYRTVKQPYVDLLELHRTLQQDQARGVRPTELRERGVSGPVVGPPTVADHHILEWCNRHGLLGILPVLSTSVRLADTEHQDEPAIERTQYVRDGDRWHIETALQFEWLSTSAATDEHVRERAEGSHGTFSWFNFGARTHDQRPLADLWDYFPLAGARHDGFVPPVPFSEEFWRSYGEPVWEISRFCDLFTRAVDHLKPWGADATTDHQPPKATRASLFLKDLARNVEVDDLENTRRSAGLLASYALMVLWDRADDRRCLQCVNCKRHFASNDKRARYCSPRCRNIVQSRRHREKRAAQRTP